MEDQSHKSIIDVFEELKSMELEANRLYQVCMESITDNEDIDILRGIMQDEEKHAKMAQKIIDIIEE